MSAPLASEIRVGLAVVRMDDGKANAFSFALLDALGAALLYAADLRIGAAGPYKIGLNEVAIGLALPAFASELARARLSPRHLQRATALAEVFDAAGAVEAGFLDRTVPADRLEAAVIEAAAALATLPAKAHALTKRGLRAATLEALRASLP